MPPGCRRQQRARRLNPGPWQGLIGAILEEDNQRSRKQRHTATRIFERLRVEHRRSYEREATVYSPLDHLALLEHKSRVLDQAAPLTGWQLPMFLIFHGRIEPMGHDAPDQHGKSPHKGLLVGKNQPVKFLGIRSRRRWATIAITYLNKGSLLRYAKLHVNGTAETWIKFPPTGNHPDKSGYRHNEETRIPAAWWSLRVVASRDHT